MIRPLLAALWLAAAPAFADDVLDARLKSLETQLRCLVCQNQTLAESEAPLAADLRNEVRELAQSGKSDDDIRAYLVARYGDFVLYKPPVKPVTYLLWFGPFLLLAGGLAVWLLVLRQRGRMKRQENEDLGLPASVEADVDIARARELLDD
ncbi:MAG TPA: cytochrome c-type biogenesis protein [Casimicrobiaceae bacterium]|nr:cytochrome c-type biogenesis protein [Casimicrobiaceae bacterium]